MFNPDYNQFKSALSPFENAARTLTIEPITTPVRNDAEIKSTIEAVGRRQGGLLVLTDAYLSTHRATIIAAATRSKVPTIANDVTFARFGGLLVYVPRHGDMFRGAAGYIDRILRGAKPADLPVQLPVKFDMAVNAKTAKALGLTVPQSILLRADEVIE